MADVDTVPRLPAPPGRLACRAMSPRRPDPYPLGAAVFRGAFRLLDLDVQAVGSEHIPVRGPAVLAANHVGYLDFAFVALAPPAPRRRIRYVVRRDVFAHPVAGPLLRSLRQIEAAPPGGGGATLDRAVELLQQGEVVGIHPEGTISPSFHPRPARTGTVRIAAAAGAPIIPVAVWGSHRLLTKWRPRNLQRGVAVRVHYGAPMHVTGDDPVAETTQLMDRIRALLTTAWETYPQQPADDQDRWWLPASLGGTAPDVDEAEQRLAAQRARRLGREVGREVE